MANYTHTVRNWQEAHDVFNAARKNRRGTVNLGYATELRHWADAYAIRHHDTDIVTFYSNGDIELYSGGWLSATTVERMHEFTPREIVINGRDLYAKRYDAWPRYIIRHVEFEWSQGRYCNVPDFDNAVFLGMIDRNRTVHTIHYAQLARKART